MKFYIYLIDLLDSDIFKFIIKFRNDNSLNICFIDTKRCLLEKHDLLVSLNKIDFLPNTFKLFNFNKSRPYLINIIKEKELDFEIKFKKPDECQVNEFKTKFKQLYGTKFIQVTIYNIT